MARRIPQRLERVLGINALFASAYGNVGSNIYFALGLVAALALGLTPLVFLLSGIVFYLTAVTYTEATTMYPEAGGSSSFARHAFNELVSFAAAHMQALSFIVTASISALFVPHYLGFLWDGLRSAPWDIVGGAIVLAGLCALNVRGVKEAARLNVAMAVTDLATQLALVVAGAVLVLDPETLTNNVHWGTAPTWSQFVLAIPVAMLAYTGIETISNMSEEAKDAGTTVPRAMARVVGAVVVIYAALPAIALSALPVTQTADGEYQTLLGVPEDEGGFAADPVLGVVTHMHLGFLEGAAEVYVGLLAASILVLAANAALFGVSRLIYSMGAHRQVPDPVRRLHPRYHTPFIGLILCAAAAIALLFGPAAFLGNLLATIAMISFTVAHASLVRLRITHKEVPRPFQAPLSIPWRGHQLPVTALIGGLATAAAAVVVASLHPEVLIVAGAWLAVGLGGYVAFRRQHGLSLTRTVRVAIPDPVVERELEYRRVLVICDPAETAGDALHVALGVADQRSHVEFVSLIPIPAGYPFDVTLETEDRLSRDHMSLARRLLGRRARVRSMRCPRGDKAARIIREALLLRADAIVMPMPPLQRRISQDNLFGGTRLRLLDERPCRVLLVDSGINREIFDRETVGPCIELPVDDRPPQTRAARTRARGEMAPRRLMVAVFGEPLDTDVVQTACRMAVSTDRQHAEIHAVAVANVAHDCDPSDADEGELERLRSALLFAEAVGQEYEGVDVIPHLFAAHHVAGTMVRVAEDLDVEVILLAADDAVEEARNRDAATLVGRVTQTVMRYAPCRVVLTAAAFVESAPVRQARAPEPTA